MDLKDRKCVPCEGGVPPLGPREVRDFLDRLPGWTLRDEKIRRRFEFRDFAEAMAFVNRVAGIAETEGHHPDIAIHWNQVDIVLWTHAIGGLSQNDFIMAAKIDVMR